MMNTASASRCPGFVFLRGIPRLLPLLFLIVAAGGQMSAGMFTQVPTSFGPSTALRDDSTGLEWLHLNLTANHSYNYVILNLASGGSYSGWRFATPAELAAFFLDYSGGTTNDTIALNFMNDLGGPLWDASNPTTGFHRQSSYGRLDVPFELGHATYGYIAVDNFAGPSIDPSLQGSSVDYADIPSIGSWLVRASVPEPGAWTLCLSGLASAAFLSLYRRSKL